MTDVDTAVLDRIVDGETAVMLLEADGDVVAERTLPVDRLPEDGQAEGAVYSVTVADDDIAELSYQPEETEARRESAQDRFDRLSERLDEK